MLDGGQRRRHHVDQLVALVSDVPCKFNLIPFNPFPNSGLARSSDRTDYVRLRSACRTPAS